MMQEGFSKTLRRAYRKNRYLRMIELPHYETGLRVIYSDLVTPERTGLPGRPKGPIQVIHEDLDYATVHKVRKDGQVVQVTRQIVFGTDTSIEKRLADSPSVAINTA